MHTFYLNSSNTACHRLFIRVLPDPSVIPSIALSILIHLWYHPSLLLHLPDPSLVPPILLLRLLPDPSVVQSIAPSTASCSIAAFWSTACTIHRSHDFFLIHRLHHPSLFRSLPDHRLNHLSFLRSLPDPSVVSSIASSAASWSIGGVITHFQIQLTDENIKLD